MKRGAVLLASLALLGACSAGGGGGGATATTAPPEEALARALLNQSQLRRVPGLPTATVTALPTTAAFDEPDPRGPCGAAVPRLDLSDAVGTSWRATTLQNGAQLVVRGSARELQAYLAARIKDARGGCDVFDQQNRAGVTQEIKYEQSISVSRNTDQSLAVVMAVRANGTVRALTIIEVRTNNVLSRAVIVTSRPMPVPTVRGIASLLAKALEPFA